MNKPRKSRYSGEKYIGVKFLRTVKSRCRETRGNGFAGGLTGGDPLRPEGRNWSPDSEIQSVE